MRVEIGRKKGKEIIELEGRREICEEERKEENHRLTLCKELGLKKQTEVFPLDTIDPKLFYHEMDELEILTWEMFLPKSYLIEGTIVRGDFPQSFWRFSDYEFDKIPIEILEEIFFAKKTGLFSSIEIRTLERDGIDPIAVGRTLDARSFFIARWGESLQDFKEIFYKMWFPMVVVFGRGKEPNVDIKNAIVKFREITRISALLYFKGRTWRKHFCGSKKILLSKLPKSNPKGFIFCPSCESYDEI